MNITISATADTKGLDELLRNDQRKRDAVLEVAQFGEALIKNTFSHTSPAPGGAPPGVDTGALKNSIIAESSGNDATISDGVEYGAHLEYGTSKMAARPFMRPAAVRLAKMVAEDANFKLEFLGDKA